MEARSKTHRRVWLAGMRHTLVGAFAVRTRWIGSWRKVAFWASPRRTTSARQPARCARRISVASPSISPQEMAPRTSSKSEALERDFVNLGVWQSKTLEGIRGSKIFTPSPDSVTRTSSATADEYEKT